jgi:hypothetical protein
MSTEVNGLWHSSNINSQSPGFTQVNGYRFRQPERIFYNPFNSNEVWVTSFGNGIKVGYTSPVMITLNLTIGIEGMWNGAAQVQDTVRLFLRNSFSPFVAIDSSVGVTSSTGNVVVNFLNAQGGSYYIQIKHRNALNWADGVFTVEMWIMMG